MVGTKAAGKGEPTARLNAGKGNPTARVNSEAARSRQPARKARERPQRRITRVVNDLIRAAALGQRPRRLGRSARGRGQAPVSRQPETGLAWDPQEGCPRFARGRAASGHEAHKAMDPC